MDDSEQNMRSFKVATFVNAPKRAKGLPLKRSHISAYTTWYNPSWPGCVEFVVKAPSGKVAKGLAVRLRFLKETGRLPT